MGCSWFSVVTLAVLILASFLANMKANTETTISMTALHSDMIMDTSESPKTASTADKHATTVVTMNTVNVLENCSFKSVEQLDNEESGQNSSETKSCINSITTPVSGNSSSNESKNVILKRTYRDFPEYKHYERLTALSVYITSIPGFITNPLTILIAMMIKPRNTCELYMILLASADLLAVTGRFIDRVVGKLAETRYSWECKLFWYTSTIGLVYSNLILMSWTFERFIAVMFPMKLGMWCSIRNTKITLSVLFVVCLTLSVPYLTEHEAITFWNGQTFISVCILSEFIYTLWIHIESVYLIYIPVLVVCTCNIMILFRINAMTKARISMASNKETIDKKVQENKRMTILLLSISAVFLLLHIPYIIAMVIDYLYPDMTVLLLKDPHLFAKILLYKSLGYILTEFQNCVNFFLYCLSGSKFRTMFRKLFCKCISDEQKDTLRSSKTDTTKI